MRSRAGPAAACQACLWGGGHLQTLSSDCSQDQDRQLRLQRTQQADSGGTQIIRQVAQVMPSALHLVWQAQLLKALRNAAFRTQLQTGSLAARKK